MGLSPPPSHRRSYLPIDACLLQQGERVFKPDVYVIRKDEQPVVVKDYRRYRGTPMALPARFLVWHEARILRRLAGWCHAPALVGVGALALGMEFIPGETLSQSVGLIGREVFDQLQAALLRLHSEGITHNDLHGTNVIVCAGGPVLIDFTSAWYSPRWLRRGPLFRQLRRGDWKNLLKLRQRITGLAPTPRQAELAAEPRWVRKVRVGWKRFYRGTGTG